MKMELKDLKYEIKIKEILSFLSENIQEAENLKNNFATKQNYDEAA